MLVGNVHDHTNSGKKQLRFHYLSKTWCLSKAKVLAVVYYMFVYVDQLFTYYSRVIYGNINLGCYYHNNGCGPAMTVRSNTSFTTKSTYIQ